jgi:hypothetical protein
LLPRSPTLNMPASSSLRGLPERGIRVAVWRRCCVVSVHGPGRPSATPGRTGRPPAVLVSIRRPLACRAGAGRRPPARLSSGYGGLRGDEAAPVSPVRGHVEPRGHPWLRHGARAAAGRGTGLCLRRRGRPPELPALRAPRAVAGMRSPVSMCRGSRSPAGGAGVEGGRRGAWQGAKGRDGARRRGYLPDRSPVMSTRTRSASERVTALGEGAPCACGGR